MKILGSGRHYYWPRISIVLIMIVLTAGMEGCLCSPASQNPEIRTWYDLEAIRDNLSGHYVLMNDLDSNTAGYQELAGPTANEGKGWHPIIGSGGNPPFTGTFDGQGYEIHDLFINLPGIGYVGLFSILGEGGRIEDVGVVNADVDCTAYIGSLVGVNFGTVTNSYSTGSVTATLNAGGLVGNNLGTVTNSYSTANVTGDYSAGGLAGGNSGTVINSYAAGGVTGEQGVGGLVGTNNGTVVNCYSVGSVSGNNSIGGLVGYSEGTVTSSFWDTQTSGQPSSAGGAGKTTAEMQVIATFSAWNITTVATPGTRNTGYIWNIVSNVTYPFLSWQPVS
jgi:hypothetical protein